MSKNIGFGDAVFTTNFSYFATTEVISLLGANPIFVDINQKTFNIDPALLEIEIQKTFDKGILTPKAIIVVDLFGQLADYKKITKIAKKYNLFVIEDAAQSFGASYDDKKSCSFGDVAATSFFPAKPLGCYGDGGAIFTNDDELANIFKSIRMHGQGKDKYDNIRVGLNSRLDTIQATVLLNKLKIFDDELVMRDKIASFYSENLNKNLIVPYISELDKSAWAQYSLITKNKNERNLLIDYLNKNNIPTAVYYKKIFSDLVLYKDKIKKAFPVSKKISKTILSIPMHPYLSKIELAKIVNTINEFYQK